MAREYRLMPREYRSLELNESNVISYLKSVIVNPKDDKDKPVIGFTFLPSNPKVEEIPISLSKISGTTVLYLFGQLKAVHEHKKILTLADMAINYKDERWTDNPQAVFALSQVLICV